MTKADAERKEQRIAQLEKKCELLSEQLQQALSHSATLALQNAASPQTAANDTTRHEAKQAQQQEPIIEEPPMMNSIHARYSELFMLYEQGKSIEMISKKLGMNKGEVQLIIQLAKQEAAVHA
jgi:DNA-directed RNA polymerase specialized sigma24 family protein